MRILFLVFCLLFWAAIPVMHGQENGFTPCTATESLAYVNSILDISLVDAPPVETIDDLVAHAAERLESRENRITLVPLCAEFIALQRQDFFISGDLIGRAALQLAGVPNDANPYLLRLPSLEERRQANSELFSRADSNETPATEDRILPVCAIGQSFKLESWATEFEVLLLNAANANNWINAVDQLLQWRVENLSTVPECLEAIEFGFLLAKAVSDAALQFALRHAGVADEQNPYVETVETARGKLRDWRGEITLTRPENQGATVLILGKASVLPPCNSVEIAYAYRSILDEVMEVIELSQNLESPTAMIDYGQSHIDLREGTLSRFSLCEELFELNWAAQQFLDATAAYVSYQIWGFPPEENPFAAPLLESADAFVAWSDAAAEYLRDLDGIVGPAPDEREVAACSASEITFMLVYLIPDFRSFVSAGLAMATIEDRSTLFEHSYSLRDRLWNEMPRCAEALEIGLLMRKMAGDWLSMLAVDSIVLKREDNPYVSQVQNDLDRFLELNDELTRAPDELLIGSLARQFYTVTANPYANIRSCASTDCAIIATARKGETLRVTDDSADWYEIRLKDGRTAYIAGFLTSKTQPAP